MDNSRQAALVLGGTGRTGSLVARKLAERGLSARTASRHGADVPFDWDNPATHGPALAWVMQNFTDEHRDARAWALPAVRS